VHVVVGTPGRVIDHLERGSLDLSELKHAGAGRSRRNAAHGLHRRRRGSAQEDPGQRQVALFSATMPAQIKRIAQTYLRDPAEVTIKSKTTTARTSASATGWSAACTSSTR
jgi:ATP-dependent RNA helicase DeaD